MASGWLVLTVFGLTYLSFVQGIRLVGLTTENSTVSTIPFTFSMPLYRINSTTGTTCILIRTDGLLSVKYRNKLGEDSEAYVYLPDYPQLTGDCSKSDSESLTMSFNGLTLSMYFKKTPGGERWYMDGVELTYSSNNKIFKNIDRPNLDVKLTTASQMFFPIPLGKSYTCNEEKVLMYSSDKNDKSGHTAQLLLRDLRMQSFMSKESGQWGPIECSTTGIYRDVSTALTVGTALAVVILVNISGYRY